MPIERKFLDWTKPALQAAADELLDGRCSGGIADLSNLIAAVPGGRAGRRLLELLVEKAEAASLSLLPPEIITVGRLPELLYTPQKPFADELTQRLAWVEALKQTREAEKSVSKSGPKKKDGGSGRARCAASPSRGASRLSAVFGELPSDDDLLAWLPLGELLADLHRELAADTLDFADVAACGKTLAGFNETERWQMLADVQRRYLEILDGLELWDIQTARRVAIEQKECRTDRQIVLVGTVDLNRTQRAMLDQVAEHVVALVFAPPEMRDRFDEHGCLLPNKWIDAPIALSSQQIEVVDRPGDQADAVIRAIGTLQGRYSPEEITVGVPDERLIPLIQQRLDECEVPNRYGVGWPVVRSGLCRLLQIVADYLETLRAPEFAALVRHPDLCVWLLKQGVRGDWLTALDRYISEHLPAALAGTWVGQEQQCALLREVYEKVNDGLLASLSGGRRSLAEWSPAIVALLEEVYGGKALDPDDPHDRMVISACEKIVGVLNGHDALPSGLALQVTCSEAIRLTLQALETEPIPPQPDRSAVELLGWLELPWDDAPVLIVTGFNEGLVPQSRNGDLFLPNELRRQLGLEDNDRIYARDAYAVSLLAASRKHLTIVAGRRSTDNDPLAPSRLLFACPAEELARRVRAFLAPQPARRLVLPGSLRAGRSKPIFAPPRPHPETPAKESLRVTEFRDYLACPYRYYLRHRLGLKAVDDAAEELGGAEFGELMHNVLKEFGSSSLADSGAADEIARELHLMLERLAAETFGKQTTAAVAVQLEQMRYRLTHFARWQADWRRAGWKIQLTECSVPDETVTFPVDGRPVYLRGRIDRIDVNERTGKWVVFDYKTGESAKPPEKTHRRRGEWVDLQLPLYRHLVRGIETVEIDSDDLALGYIVIPKSVQEIGEHLADWTPDELEEADETARQVVRDIRSGRFYPPEQPPPPFFEEYAAICLDGSFGVLNLADQQEV